MSRVSHLPHQLHVSALATRSPRESPCPAVLENGLLVLRSKRMVSVLEQEQEPTVRRREEEARRCWSRGRGKPRRAHRVAAGESVTGMRPRKSKGTESG